MGLGLSAGPTNYLVTKNRLNWAVTIVNVKLVLELVDLIYGTILTISVVPLHLFNIFLLAPLSHFPQSQFIPTWL